MVVSGTTGKRVLVTGASDGIGKATAVALARAGAKVVILARTEAKGQAARQAIRSTAGVDVEVVAADLSSQQQVRWVAAEYKRRFDRLDVLVNNAGVLASHRRVTADGLEETFAVNHLAYFLLTRELLDILQASAPARVVNVSSEAHRGARMQWDDLQFATHRYGSWRAYGQSKLADLLFTYELARRLEGTGITANAVHPGTVGTGLARTYGGPAAVLMRLARPFLLSPEEGARTSVYLAGSQQVEGVSGRYFSGSRALASNEYSYCEPSQKKLWAISEELTGARVTRSASQLGSRRFHPEELSARDVEDGAQQHAGEDGGEPKGVGVAAPGASHHPDHRAPPS
jgi:NAD(P)-dependent dehydrogenase (short-subunit alcohol dehydrogenase family)